VVYFVDVSGSMKRAFPYIYHKYGNQQSKIQQVVYFVDLGGSVRRAFAFI